MTDPAFLFNLDRARRDPVSAAEHLRAAERAASAVRNWIDLAAAWIPHDYDQATRCLQVALRRDDGEVSLARDAAVLAVRLGDRPLARAALDLAAATLEARGGAEPSWGRLWLGIAHDYEHLLGDTDAASRCLHLANRPHVSLEERCQIAEQLARFPAHRASAIAILADVEANLPPAENAVPGVRVAQLYIALGEKNAARRILGASRVDREDVFDHCAAARAWAEIDIDKSYAVLDQALERADTVSDGLGVAITAHQLGRGLVVERALERAADLATSRNRIEVTRSIVELLGNAGAELLAEARRPDDAVARRWHIYGFDADPNTFFDSVRRKVADVDLEAIAQLDGGYAAERHLERLRFITHQGLLPAAIGWAPAEVLAAARDREDDLPVIVRTFACAVFCLGAASPVEDGRPLGVEAALAVLLDGARILGAIDEAFVGFLAAIAGGLEGHERAFALLALLLAVVSINASDRRIGALAPSLEEVVAHQALLGAGHLFGATLYTSQHGRWRRLVDEILGPRVRRRAAIRRVVELLDQAAGTSTPTRPPAPIRRRGPSKKKAPSGRGSSPRKRRAPNDS